MTQPIDRTIPISSGVSLHVRDWQAEERVSAPIPAPFVLLHGIASNARIWDGAASRLAAAGRRALAVDFRGHGLSDAPDEGYDAGTFAADVAALVAELKLERPIIVGQSLGANVVLEAAVRHPQLPRAIVLVEGGVAGAPRQFESWEQLRANIRLPPVAGIPAPGVEAFLRKANPGWPDWRVAAAMASFRSLPDGTLEWRLTPPRMESLLHSLWDEPADTLWPLVRVPCVAVLCDTGDPAWTAAKRAAAAAFTAQVPDARIVWFAAEHDVHAALPDEIAALLLDSTEER